MCCEFPVKMTFLFSCLSLTVQFQNDSWHVMAFCANYKLLQGLSCCCILQTVNVRDRTATPARYQQELQKAAWLWANTSTLCDNILCLYDLLTFWVHSSEKCVFTSLRFHLGSEVISPYISSTCLKSFTNIYICVLHMQRLNVPDFCHLPQKEVGDMLRRPLQFQKCCQ